MNGFPRNLVERRGHGSQALLGLGGAIRSTKCQSGLIINLTRLQSDLRKYVMLNCC